MGAGEKEEELADCVYSYPAPPSQPLPAIPLPLTSGTEEDTGYMMSCLLDPVTCTTDFGAIVDQRA